MPDAEMGALLEDSSKLTYRPARYRMRQHCDGFELAKGLGAARPGFKIAYAVRQRVVVFAGPHRQRVPKEALTAASLIYTPVGEQRVTT